MPKAKEVALTKMPLGDFGVAVLLNGFHGESHIHNRVVYGRADSL